MSASASLGCSESKSNRARLRLDLWPIAMLICNTSNTVFKIIQVTAVIAGVPLLSAVTNNNISAVKCIMPWFKIKIDKCSAARARRISAPPESLSQPLRIPDSCQVIKRDYKVICESRIK